MSDHLNKAFNIILDDVEFLKANDPVFKSHFSLDYKVERDRGAVDLSALIRIIIGQQISTKAADSLWQKLTNKYDPNDAAKLMVADDTELRDCGLSRQKVAYLHGVSRATHDNVIDINQWINMDDATVLADITSLKGFGVWSAQMFMMFNLCRRHIWPAGDLGIQIGLHRYYGLDDRPNEKQAKLMIDDFMGRETAAAFLLWDLKENKA